MGPFAPRPARAGHYEILASESAGPAAPLASGVALNELGDVAFRGVPPQGGVGLYVTDGVTWTEIAHTDGPIELFGTDVDLSDTGVTAFKAFLDDGGSALFVGSGGPLATRAEAPGPVFESFNQMLATNGAGAVTFKGNLHGGGQAVALADAQGIALLYLTGSTYTSLLRSDVNDAGQVSFCANLASGHHAILRGDGGPAVTIATTSGGTFADLLSGDCATLNDAGEVAFAAELPGGGSGIFLGDGTAAPVFLAGTASGYAAVDVAALNDVSEIAFLGEFPDGTRGIFRGPDPAADAVVRTGWMIDGAVVTSVALEHHGHNVSGQIAFQAMLGGRGRALVRATPGACAPVLGPCQNGIDDDGDGDVDFPDDPGCASANDLREDPACDDDLDNDGDGGIDWDGVGGLHAKDPHCSSAVRNSELRGSFGCGLGVELVFFTALLAAPFRRRDRRHAG